jgi:hypothetical protein
MTEKKKKDKSHVEITLQRIRAFSDDMHKNCDHEEKKICEVPEKTATDGTSAQTDSKSKP